MREEQIRVPEQVSHATVAHKSKVACRIRRKASRVSAPLPATH